MVFRLKLTLVLLAALHAPIALRAGEIVDGIVATVNGVAILQSDVEQALRCEALFNGLALSSITPAQQQAVRERLIDQELLRQQMANTLPPPQPHDLQERILQVRRQIPEASSVSGWRAVLERYGLSEQEVAERIAVQMQIAAFVDLHLQSNVQVDSASVRAYYQEKFLPELRQRRAPEPPLTEVSGQIEAILRQQREDELLNSWLHSLRQQSRIETEPGLHRNRNAHAGASGSK
jgi:parvulin-like peptidyl-prolyl isomerase